MKKIFGFFIIIVLITGCAVSGKNIKSDTEMDISKADSQQYIKYLNLNSQNKNIKEQKDILLNLSKKYPQSEQIKRDLIDLYFENGENKSALELTEKLLKKYPDDLNLLYKKANIIESTGGFSESTYKKIIKNSKQPVLPRFKLANHYYEKKKYKEAFNQYK